MEDQLELIFSNTSNQDEHVWQRRFYDFRFPPLTGWANLFRAAGAGAEIHRAIQCKEWPRGLLRR